MTIITKPLSEKKENKLEAPLVENDQLANPATPEDVEAQKRSVLILQARAHRISAMTTFCLLLAALSVVGIGIIAGTYFYDQYLKIQNRMSQAKFEGWAQIPYPYDDDMLNDDDNSITSRPYRSYFKENLEIDNDEMYEKINVPDFKDGRNGRFIHDFNTNITGIIDLTGNRCFVMPLNRDNVLPPKSLFDLIHKMWEGYYKVNTEVVRETMRVVTPPITDMKSVGDYIAKECDGLRVYKLEKYVGGVVKRSADLHPEAKFAQFAGKGILEFDIINMDEVAEFEKQH